MSYKSKVNPFNSGKLQKVLDATSLVQLTFKERVPTFADLPATGNTVNDARFVDDTHHLYVWDGSVWVDQGDVLDINWGSIEGDINNQTDLKNALDAKLSSVSWGDIIGDLLNQTDLQSALDDKIDKFNPATETILASHGESWTDLSLRHSVTTEFNPTLDTSDYKFGTGCWKLSNDVTSGVYGLVHVTNNESDFQLFNDLVSEKTFSLFVKIPNETPLSYTNGIRGICSFGDGTDAWSLNYRFDSKIFGFKEEGDHESFGSTCGSLEYETWHHLAIVKKADKIGIYLDGIQTLYKTLSSPIILSELNGLVFGNSYKYYGNVKIDELFLYNGNFFDVTPNIGLTSTINVPTSSGSIITHFDAVAHIEVDGSLKRSSKKIDEIIYSEADGDWKKVTMLQYNPVTEKFKVVYET